jgi:hypothetical protein
MAGTSRAVPSRRRIPWLPDRPDRDQCRVRSRPAAGIVAAVIRAILHLTNDQPLLVDLLEEPTPRDIAIVCTNARSVDGKKPVFIDFTSSTFVFPMSAIRFVEILRLGEDGEGLTPVVSSAPAEPEDLEIDEDFLRRVREA